MKYLRTIGLTIALSLSPLIQRIVCAQDAPSPKGPDSAAISDPSGIPASIHLVGLTDIKPATTGVLRMTKASVEFTTSDTHASIPYERIIAVFSGSERTEAGGKAGAVGRKMPYGAGQVFSLASKKQEDLLTIEFRDDHGGYHGTVFVVPMKSGEPFRSALNARIQQAAPAIDQANCMNETPISNSVLLEPVKVEGVDLPAEYRVLFYENVHHVLTSTDAAEKYLRPGDAGCAALTLHITVAGFKKGNQSLRAATGPIGMFAGVTSVTFNIKLEDPHGTVILQQGIKKSKRGDSDSLNLAHDLAKDISKRVEKVMQKTNGAG